MATESKSTSSKKTTPASTPEETLTKVLKVLKDNGFEDSKSASWCSEFIGKDSRVDVSYHIGSGKLLFKTGLYEYFDSDMTYQVVATTKRGETISSISGGAEVDFPLADFESAIKESIKKIN